MKRAQRRRRETARLAQVPHRHRREIPGNPRCRVHHQRHRRRAIRRGPYPPDHVLILLIARAARPDPARPVDRQRHRRRRPVPGLRPFGAETGHWPASGTPLTPHVPGRHRGPRRGGDHTVPQDRQALEGRQSRGNRPQRNPATIEAPRPDHLATMGRASPTKPRRDMVILPVLSGRGRRTQAAIFSFMAGVTPPMPMLGRSLL